MTLAMTMHTASEIVHALRANGFSAERAPDRQVLNLAEEAGEFIGAYRRWAGLARRTGTAEQVHAELADVVITSYVTAAELDIDLDAAVAYGRQHGYAPAWSPGGMAPEGEVYRRVLTVTVAVARFVQADLDELPWTRRVTLAKVVCAAYAAAQALAFDLDAAITAKLAVVFSRGWRENAAESGVDAPESVPCWFGCGYLATSESDLNTHEDGCEQADLNPPTFYGSTEEFLADMDALAGDTPTPRPARSVRKRRDRSGGAQ